MVELFTIEDVLDFMDTTKNAPEKNDFLGNDQLNIDPLYDFQNKNRIVGFFSDIEDYSAEYSSFLSIAEKISYRYDLRIGIVYIFIYPRLLIKILFIILRVCMMEFGSIHILGIQL